MAYYNKIGLLILNEAQDKFLVCEKEPENVTDQWILPGGKLEEESDEECLKHEIKEELDCEVDLTTLEYIGTYHDIAAGFTDRDVEIKLYRGEIIGKPTPSSEISAIHWIGKDAINNERASSIIRKHVIPEIVAKGILK